MNSSDIITALKNKSGSKNLAAKTIVDIFFNQLADALSKGDRVEIRGFGSFTVRKYKAYTGRNPSTGETVTVKSKKLPFFKCGKELKERADHISDRVRNRPRT